MSNYGSQVEVIKDIFGVYFGANFKFMDEKSKSPRSKKLSFGNDIDNLNTNIDAIVEILKESSLDGKQTFNKIIDRCNSLPEDDLVYIIGVSLLIYLYNIKIYLSDVSINIDYSIYPDNYKKGSRNRDCYVKLCDSDKYNFNPAAYNISAGKLKIVRAFIDYSRSQISRENDNVVIKTKPLQIIEMPLSFNTSATPIDSTEERVEVEEESTASTLDNYEYACLREISESSLRKAVSSGSAGPIFRNKIYNSMPRDTRIIDLVESCSIDLEPIKSFILWKLIVASQTRQDATILCRVELPLPAVALERLKNWLVEHGFENPIVLNRDLFVMPNIHGVEHYIEVCVNWNWIDIERN